MAKCGFCPSHIAQSGQVLVAGRRIMLSPECHDFIQPNGCCAWPKIAQMRAILMGSRKPAWWQFAHQVYDACAAWLRAAAQMKIGCQLWDQLSGNLYLPSRKRIRRRYREHQTATKLALYSALTTRLCKAH